MAKRSRRPVAEPAATTVGRRTTRRRPTRRIREESVLERYRSLLLGGVVAAGVLLIVFLAFQTASAQSYVCLSELTPGPVETPATAQPSVSPSASASASPAGSPGQSPSGSPEPSASAAASASPTAAASAAPSPTAAASPSALASPTPVPSPGPSPTARLGFNTSNLGATHVSDRSQTIRYGFCPPTSGNHWNVAGVAPLPAAVYPPTQQQTPASWVHNLEHGYVVVLYRCPSDADCPSDAELAQMQQWFDQAPKPTLSSCASKALVVRFDDMTTRFAIVAWNRALLMDEFDLDTALTFAQQWTEHDKVPEPAAC